MNFRRLKDKRVYFVTLIVSDYRQNREKYNEQLKETEDRGERKNDAISKKDKWKKYYMT